MNAMRSTVPPCFGLFQRRMEGDDALLRLAQLRFQQSGLAPEIYAATLNDLEHLIQFCPAGQSAVMTHLDRKLDWIHPDGQRRILEFATRFAGRVRGMVVHDCVRMATCPRQALEAACALDRQLAAIADRPTLFIEYAIGLEMEVFARFFETARGLLHISACVDVGHVGIFQTRQLYARLHPGEDICGLKQNPEAQANRIQDVEEALHSALPEVLKLNELLGQLGKHVHFHLHDGHPYSRWSPFGVSDHLGFLDEIPIPFVRHGKSTLPLMFGPDGLRAICASAWHVIGPENLSFSLEIHPRFERTPLGDAASLFAHWRDLTHAEQMNHWLSVLTRNHALLRQALQAAAGKDE